MNSNTSGDKLHDKALRAWQLALLRFAITMDNADRLALLAIATELDAPGARSSARRRLQILLQGERRALPRHYRPAASDQRGGVAAAPDAMQRRTLEARVRGGTGNRYPSREAIYQAAKAKQRSVERVGATKRLTLTAGTPPRPAARLRWRITTTPNHTVLTNGFNMVHRSLRIAASRAFTPRLLIRSRPALEFICGLPDI